MKQMIASRKKASIRGRQTRRSRGQESKSMRSLLASQHLNLRRIVVPLDFSGKSRQALKYAVPLAERYGGKIFLIHVLEPAYAYPFHPGEIGIMPVKPRSLIAASKERLSRLAHELVPPEVFGETIIQIGRPYHEIIDSASKAEADLIVIATHGYFGVKEALLGSTAERVVRHAHCSVLTVRRNGDQPGNTSLPIEGEKSPLSARRARRMPWQRILVPIDFSEISLRAFDVAVPLASDRGVRLILLSIIEPAAYFAGMEGVPIAMPDTKLAQQAKVKLAAIVQRFIPRTTPVTCLVHGGKPFDVIARSAQERDVDLIVLTTHGRTGLGRVFMGSTAERVVRHAHCPVYVVRSFG